MIHCTVCQHDKPAAEFSASMVHGPHGQCRACMALYRAERKQETEGAMDRVRASLPPVQCAECKTAKSPTEFSAHTTVPTCVSCWQTSKPERKRESMAALRATQTRDEQNAAMAAYRAGMRKDKCAVCGSAIEGHGICQRCMDAITVLGGSPDDLKRAAKALKYMREQ